MTVSTPVVHICWGEGEIDAFYAYAQKLAEATHPHRPAAIVAGLDWENLTSQQFDAAVIQALPPAEEAQLPVLHLHLPNASLQHIPIETLEQYPLVLHFHEFIFAKSTLEFHLDLIPHAERIIVSSTEEKAAIKEHFPDIADQCQVVRVGSNVPVVDNPPEVRSNSPVYYGTIRWPKGIREILDVAEEMLARQDPDHSRHAEELVGEKIIMMGGIWPKYEEFIKEVVSRIYDLSPEELNQFPSLATEDDTERGQILRDYLATLGEPVLPVEFIPQVTAEEASQRILESRFFLAPIARGITGSSGTMVTAAEHGCVIMVPVKEGHERYLGAVVAIDPQRPDLIVDELVSLIRNRETTTGLSEAGILAYAGEKVARTFGDIAAQIEADVYQPTLGQEHNAPGEWTSRAEPASHNIPRER